MTHFKLKLSRYPSDLIWVIRCFKKYYYHLSFSGSKFTPDPTGLEHALPEFEHTLQKVLPRPLLRLQNSQ